MLIKLIESLVKNEIIIEIKLIFTKLPTRQ